MSLKVHTNFTETLNLVIQFSNSFVEMGIHCLGIHCNRKSQDWGFMEMGIRWCGISLEWEFIGLGVMHEDKEELK